MWTTRAVRPGNAIESNKTLRSTTELSAVRQLGRGFRGEGRPRAGQVLALTEARGALDRWDCRRRRVGLLGGGIPV